MTKEYLIAIGSVIESDVAASHQMATAEHTPTGEQWADYCKNGSCWVTEVELEFHHIMGDPSAPDDLSRLSPFPSHATAIQIDSRSNCLLWLDDGTPAHARWNSSESTFRRIGDDQLIPCTRVRAWAALPYPIASA